MISYMDGMSCRQLGVLSPSKPSFLIIFVSSANGVYVVHVGGQWWYFQVSVKSRSCHGKVV
jgi:hypothetical protein